MSFFKKLKTVENSSKSKEGVSKTSTDSEDVENWRERRCVSGRNFYALKKNILTDVTFFVGVEKKVFHAHRLLLALGSPVFEAMFYGPLAEKGNSVTIPDVDPEGFKLLLDYLYTDFATFEDDVTTFKTAFTADKYCVPCLKEKCEQFLCSVKINTSNVWTFLQNAIYLDLCDIRKMCFDFLTFRTDVALKDTTFLDMNAITVEALLRHNSLLVSESELLESVIQWAHHNSDAEDKNSFKNLIMPLLRFIRFKAIQADKFVQFLEAQKLKEVLERDDAMCILEHLSRPDLCALPAWCCASPPREHPFQSPVNNLYVLQQGKQNSEDINRSFLAAIRRHIVTRSSCPRVAVFNPTQVRSSSPSQVSRSNCPQVPVFNFTQVRTSSPSQVSRSNCPQVTTSNLSQVAPSSLPQVSRSSCPQVTTSNLSQVAPSIRSQVAPSSLSQISRSNCLQVTTSNLSQVAPSSLSQVSRSNCLQVTTSNLSQVAPSVRPQVAPSSLSQVS